MPVKGYSSGNLFLGKNSAGSVSSSHSYPFRDNNNNNNNNNNAGRINLLLLKTLKIPSQVIHMAMIFSAR